MTSWPPGLSTFISYLSSSEETFHFWRISAFYGCTRLRFVFSPLLSSSFLFFPLLSSSFLFFPLLSSSFLFFPLLSSSFLFFPLLSSSFLFFPLLSSSFLFFPLLSSSFLFFPLLSSSFLFFPLFSSSFLFFPLIFSVFLFFPLLCYGSSCSSSLSLLLLFFADFTFFLVKNNLSNSKLSLLVKNYRLSSSTTTDTANFSWSAGFSLLNFVLIRSLAGGGKNLPEAGEQQAQ